MQGLLCLFSNTKVQEGQALRSSRSAGADLPPGQVFCSEGT